MLQTNQDKQIIILIKAITQTNSRQCSWPICHKRWRHRDPHSWINRTLCQHCLKKKWSTKRAKICFKAKSTSQFIRGLPNSCSRGRKRLTLCERRDNESMTKKKWLNSSTSRRIDCTRVVSSISVPLRQIIKRNMQGGNWKGLMEVVWVQKIESRWWLRLRDQLQLQGLAWVRDLKKSWREVFRIWARGTGGRVLWRWVLRLKPKSTH